MKRLKITVAVIISILVAFGVWVSSTPIECVTPRHQYQLSSIQTALKLFYLDTKRFPTNEEGLLILVGGGNNIKGYNAGGYINELPNDRWGNAYHYLNYQQKSGVETVAIWTYGADELPEGDEENKDIYRFLEADKILNKTQK